MKLTKQQNKNHEIAEQYLEKDYLSREEKVFIIENWLPQANHNISWDNAFFTPWDLAQCVSLELGYLEQKKPILDLCAGIGILSYRLLYDKEFLDHELHITCVEKNPDFVRVGQKILPEATWICQDVLEYEPQEKFWVGISNPPFGICKGKGKWEYIIAEKLFNSCQFGGIMIAPQRISDWIYSGQQCFRTIDNPIYEKWSKEKGIILAPNCGNDTTFYSKFTATNITTEIYCIEKREDY